MFTTLSKKQEFGPSKLTISNNLCNAEMNNYIQKDQFMKKTEIRKEYKFISDIQSESKHTIFIRKNYKTISK